MKILISVEKRVPEVGEITFSVPASAHEGMGAYAGIPHYEDFGQDMDAARRAARERGQAIWAVREGILLGRVPPGVCGTLV